MHRARERLRSRLRNFDRHGTPSSRLLCSWQLFHKKGSTHRSSKNGCKGRKNETKSTHDPQKLLFIDVERTRNMRREYLSAAENRSTHVDGKSNDDESKKRILCDINKQISQVENRNEFSNINNERFNVRIERRDMLMNEKKKKETNDDEHRGETC